MLTFLTGFALLTLSVSAAPLYRCWYWIERTAGVR